MVWVWDLMHLTAPSTAPTRVFNEWRDAVFRAAGTFWYVKLPKDHPLRPLKLFSEYRSIQARECGPLAEYLDRLLPALNATAAPRLTSMYERTQWFIAGLRRAAVAGEKVRWG